MEYTKAYKKSFWTIAAWVFGAIALVFSAYIFTDAGEGMVAYYCTFGNPLFFIPVESFAACPFYVAFAYVLFFTFASLLLVGVVVVVMDVSKLLGDKSRSFFKRSFIETRNAKTIVTLVPVGDEYFVDVYNDEFWLRADEVTAYSKFRLYLNVEATKGNIQWDKNGSRDGAVSIPRKNKASLHIATKESDRFVIHFIGKEEMFPIPNDMRPYYVIDVTISGLMSFLLIFEN